jgi:hypothetical protein
MVSIRGFGSCLDAFAGHGPGMRAIAVQREADVLIDPSG